MLRRRTDPTDLDDDCLWLIMTFIDPKELPRSASLFRKWHEVAIARFPVRIAFTSTAQWRRWLKLPFAPNISSLVIDHGRLMIPDANAPRPRLIGFDQDFPTTLSRFGGFLQNWFPRTPLFFEHVTRSQNLTTLSISGMECEYDQMEGIRRLTGLRSLSLRSCYGEMIDSHLFDIHISSTARERKAPLMTRPIRALTNLTELRLEDCVLSDETIKDISKLTQLKILSLKLVPIDQMKRQILPLLSSLSELIELDLTETGLWYCIESWPDEFSKLEKLTTLFISGNAIRPGQLNKIAQIPKLTRLVMNACCAPLTELVKMVRLTDIDISGCYDLEYGKDETLIIDYEDRKKKSPVLGDEIVTKVLGMSGLKRLILTHSGVTSIGCGLLTSMKNLTELNLSRTKIDGKCMGSLCAIKSLKVLSLSGTNISGIEYLNISGLTNLVTLDLRADIEDDDAEDELRYIGDKEIAYIYESPSITELNITKCRLTRKGLELISSMPKLVKLYIIGNSIQKNDISIIASMDRIEELSITFDMSDPLIVNSILEMGSLVQVELQHEGPMMSRWMPQWNKRMRKIKLVTSHHRCVWLLRYNGGEPHFVLVDNNGEYGETMMRELEVIKGDLFILKDN